jgi:DNA-binding NtrC family response regulator
VDLVADRFVPRGGGGAIDVATGECVVWRCEPARDRPADQRWTLRCDALQRVWHPAIATLVDYGFGGRSATGGAWRFEAWFAGAPWTGASPAALRARQTVAAFLGRCGLSAGPLQDVRVGPRGPLIVPDAQTGFECAPSNGEVAAIEECGLALVNRAVTAALIDACLPGDDVRPRVLAVWAEPGAGLSTVLRDVFRAVRLEGIIPITAPLLDMCPELREAVAGRAVLLVDRPVAGSRGQPGRGSDGGVQGAWRLFLERARRTSQVQVLLTVGGEAARALDRIGLRALPIERLVKAVCPAVRRPALDARIRRAAERSGGLPGRFARGLWGGPTVARHARWHGPRAAERAPAYGGEAEPEQEAATPPRAWPAPGELASLRRRLDCALGLIDRGRHAPGERALRQALGALARRGDWAYASAGGLALASLLLRRGRAQAALDVLRAGEEHRRRLNGVDASMDAAILAAHAWIDLARCDEAIASAGSAHDAARAAGDARRVAAATIALARASFWRAAYGDAARLLAALVPADLDAKLATAVLCHAARAAVGLGDTVAALARANEALVRAEAGATAALMAHARCASAFVRLAAGDLDAAGRDVLTGLAAARAAHDDLRAVRLRLLGVESARRMGRHGDAQPVVGRLERLARGCLPPILRARCALAAALAAASTDRGGSSAEIAKRQAVTSGLGALELFATAAPPSGRLHPDFVRGIVGVLDVCQRAEDEQPLLVRVCAQLRRQLHASAVAFVDVDRATVASDGGRIDPGIAHRAIDAGLTIDPHRTDDRLESGAPVRCGAETIGALIARWPLGTPHDLSHAAAALTMAAAAAAPVLAAVRGRTIRASAAGVELLGVSAEIASVRRAVERAAGAPFSVLIQAESGSGKELVARALHRVSPRRDRPFCALNCAALPDELIEAELFGHARGAFTGAAADRTGVFEAAHGGTLFLDEVGELSPRAQAKLLRVAQDGELRRLGENVSRSIDVRLVAATNRDLRQEAAGGRFRLDLLYRLDVIRIAVPPLRERRDDIAVLALHFWSEATSRIGSRATLAPKTIAALARYDWPGNVRELQNVLAALAVRSPRRGLVPPEALPPTFDTGRPAAAWRLDAARRTFEEQFVRAALVRAGGQRARAAEELGVTRQGLTKLMTRLGIEGG